MDCALMVNVASLVSGVLSAAFWVKSAVVKAPPPPGLENSPDIESWDVTIVNGGELYGTLRLQSHATKCELRNCGAHYDIVPDRRIGRDLTCSSP